MSIEQYRRFTEWAENAEEPTEGGDGDAEYGHLPANEDFDALLDGLDPLADDVSKHLPGQHDQRTHAPDVEAPRLFDLGDDEPAPSRASEFWGEFTQESLPIEEPEPESEAWEFDADDMHEDEHGKFWRYAGREYDLHETQYSVLGVPGRGDDVVEKASAYLHEDARGRSEDPIGAAMGRSPDATEDRHPDAFREEAFIIREDIGGDQQLLLYRKGKTSSAVSFAEGDIPSAEGAHIIHSHPSTSPLSTGDLTFGWNSKAKTMTAIGSGGLVYTAEYHDPARDVDGMDFYKAMFILDKAVNDTLRETGGFNPTGGVPMSYEDALAAHEKRQNAITQLGGHVKQHLYNEVINRYMGEHITIRHNADSNRFVRQLRDEVGWDHWHARFMEQFDALFKGAAPETRETLPYINFDA